MHTGRYIVMGVSGSGKTTIGPKLAHALGIEFVEGDALHPSANVEKMAAGIPLTDDDREPWLLRIAAHLREAKERGAGLVVASSALKRKYRDLLRSAGDPDVRFIYLKGTKPLIGERIAGRSGHFMPKTLLDSQFSTLEEPAPDEDAWVADVRESPDAVVAELVKRAR
ncbi:MAG TPA: gluconokinase [Gemmatimonadales bacterium]|nr:gluconokinase [Gemmatimonadales bacterium]